MGLARLPHASGFLASPDREGRLITSLVTGRAVSMYSSAIACSQQALVCSQSLVLSTLAGGDDDGNASLCGLLVAGYGCLWIQANTAAHTWTYKYSMHVMPRYATLKKPRPGTNNQDALHRHCGCLGHLGGFCHQPRVCSPFTATAH
jgi:hypothetical protein